MNESADGLTQIRPSARPGAFSEKGYGRLPGIGWLIPDWGLAPITAEQRRDLLEIMEDRHGRGSTMVTSQLPVEHWHEIIGHPTLADAILDRLVHNAHRLTLKGDSLRKAAAKRQKLDDEPAN